LDIDLPPFVDRRLAASGKDFGSPPAKAPWYLPVDRNSQAKADSRWGVATTADARPGRRGVKCHAPVRGRDNNNRRNVQKMTIEQTQEYDDALVTVLEAVWGEGYLSPGGPDEILTIVEGVPLAGRSLLDIGCGTGGITRFLAEKWRPSRVVGIDVDAGLIARATERAAGTGLESVLTFQTVVPGPLPFPGDSFNVVFSKDSMVHIADKESLFADIFRVLRPGGCIAAW
jgi:SAM-dependent methyltransferase